MSRKVPLKNSLKSVPPGGLKIGFIIQFFRSREYHLGLIFPFVGYKSDSWEYVEQKLPGNAEAEEFISAPTYPLGSEKGRTVVVLLKLENN